MNVFGRFMKLDSQGRMEATRVVPSNTTVEDLQDFKLMPTETIQLWQKGNRKYVTLRAKVFGNHYQTLDRLNAITAYLKALHSKSATN